MNAAPSRPEAQYEFAFPRLDTVVCVERFPDVVVIRASQDTFSDERKESFVRELVAEGFLPGPTAAGGSPRLEWKVDSAWLMPDPTAMTRTSRGMIWMFVGAVIVWAALIAWLFARPAPKSAPPQDPAAATRRAA